MTKRGTGTIKKKCKYCGKEFNTFKSTGKVYCNEECRNKDYLGKSHNNGEAISKAKKGKIPKNAWKSGKEHPRWNPNRTNQKERLIKKYIEWRSAVYQRDNWTCQNCGKVGHNLNAHHIKEFSKYPELRFIISNGITLCEDCHRKVHNQKAILLNELPFSKGE